MTSGTRSAVVFSAVKAFLIAPLPYANAGELVQIRTEFNRGVLTGLASGDTWLLVSAAALVALAASLACLIPAPGDANRSDAGPSTRLRPR
jgi:hypothetical protein